MEQQYENNHQPRRTVRRRRVRYDRIFIALAMLVVIFILLFSCTCSCVRCVCSPSGDTETSSTEPVSDSTSTVVSIIVSTSESSTMSIPSQEAVSMTLGENDVHKGTLAVVNVNHPYTFPMGDADLVNVEEKRSSSYTVNSSDIMLDETAIINLNQFISEFSTLYGKTDIKVDGGYRSKEEQDSKYSNGSSIFAGGYSDYHTGRSVDLYMDDMKSYYVASGDYAWINENAYKYGFILRYPEGKMDATGINPRAYTFHYVGVPHSYYMNENKLCLEEYVEAVKNYPATSPLTIDTDDGVWTVFYTELSSAGNAVINIPSCQEYTISGDNIGGFIIAYK